MDKKTVKKNCDIEKIARLDRLSLKGHRYFVVLTTNINTEDLDHCDMASAFMGFQENVFDHFFLDETERIIHIDDLAYIKKKSLTHLETFKEKHKNDDSEWVVERIKYVERGLEYFDNLRKMSCLEIGAMRDYIKSSEKLQISEDGLSQYFIAFDVVTTYELSLGWTADDIGG